MIEGIDKPSAREAISTKRKNICFSFSICQSTNTLTPIEENNEIFDLIEVFKSDIRILWNDVEGSKWCMIRSVR